VRRDSVTAVGQPAVDLISIFYPMWNEEEYIERALDAGRRAGQRLIDDGEVNDFELIIVNDASSDATGEIADRLADADCRIRVVHHPHNRKLGGAMRSGFAAARGDLVLYTDADLPFDMDEASKAVRLIREYEVDIVTAYRLDRTGEGYTRRIYTFVYNMLIRTLFGVKARDINFAFKLVRRKVLDHIRLRSEGSFIDAELVIRASRAGFEMLQFGVDYFPRTRGSSTLSSASVITVILKEMFQLRGDLREVRPVSREVPPTTG
jgi:glycosyltransferase involved in cell wall biosynthesis